MTGETFAAMLRRLREGRFLSQNALARAAGIDPAYVNRLEAGRQPLGNHRPSIPGRTVVLALAEVLDVSQAEADRLLFAAGLAPQVDWQTRALVAEGRLKTIKAAFATIRDALAEEAEPTMLRRRTG